ncbi:hypothetical protein BJX61DRAFT_161968 [Aspergillus egyptiacus]|nr:hypothetical protein BJX61DRAFT_161968 [Aspergillus egyptiacus]
MLHHNTSTPPPALTSPIGLRPDYICTKPTTLKIASTQGPGKALDFSVYDAETSNALFTIDGRAWGLSQHREFRDHSGLPLFELSGRWFDPETLAVRLPGGSRGRAWGRSRGRGDGGEWSDEEELLSAKIVGVKATGKALKVVVRFRNGVSGPPGYGEGSGGSGDLKKGGDAKTATGKSYHGVEAGSDRDGGKENEEADVVTLQIYGDPHYHVINTVEWNGRVIASLKKIINPREPGNRPDWEMTTAKGTDLSLMALVAIILAQKVNGDPYGRGVTRLKEVI